MGPRHGPPGANEEADVLHEIRPETGALVTLDVEPPNGDAGDLVRGRIVGAAQGVDVYRAAGGNQRLRLAPDARILVVVGVDEHRYGPRRFCPRASLPG